MCSGWKVLQHASAIIINTYIIQPFRKGTFTQSAAANIYSLSYPRGQINAILAHMHDLQW